MILSTHFRISFVSTGHSFSEQKQKKIPLTPVRCNSFTLKQCASDLIRERRTTYIPTPIPVPPPLPFVPFHFVQVKSQRSSSALLFVSFKLPGSPSPGHLLPASVSAWLPLLSQLPRSLPAPLPESSCTRCRATDRSAGSVTLVSTSPPPPR